MSISKGFLILLLISCYQFSYSQNNGIGHSYIYKGEVNPNAPKEIQDYQDFIGICDCKSMRINADGIFKDTVQMIWEFKYILDGMAIKDESWKADGGHSTSIRQFIPDSSAWYVTFFSGNAPSPAPRTWTGGTVDNGDIILKRPQKAPNGMDGFSKLKFYEISKSGFKWIGEWVDSSASVRFPFWKIECQKRR